MELSKLSDMVKVGDVLKYRQAYELDRYRVIELPNQAHPNHFRLLWLRHTVSHQNREDVFAYSIAEMNKDMSIYKSQNEILVLWMNGLMLGAAGFGFIDEVKTLLVEMEI